MSFHSLMDTIDEARAVIKAKPSPPEAALKVGNITVGLHNVSMDCDVGFADERGKLSDARKQIYKKDWNKALKTIENVYEEVYVKMSECSLEEYE